jgi:hypothetical protein
MGGIEQMANRRTLPEKWSDPWFRRLKPNEKLVFMFLCDQCNWAGFYELDYEAMSFAIGLSEQDISAAIQGLNRGCFVSNGWVWVKNFIKVQGNANLNPSNNAHLHIIRLMQEQVKRFENVPEWQDFLGPYQPLISPPVMSCSVESLNSSREKEELELQYEAPDEKVDHLYTADFLEFWNAYPNKKKKGTAAKIWKRDKLKSKLPAILDSIAMHKKSPQWKKENGAFIPHASSWLNARSYDDEVQTERVLAPQSAYGNKL